MSEQCAGCSGYSDVARLDGSERLDGDIDQPSVFGGKIIEALLPGFRQAVDRVLAGRPERRDGVRDRVVETSVERAKFVCGDGDILFYR
jgi:hypothetical protein